MTERIDLTRCPHTNPASSLSFPGLANTDYSSVGNRVDSAVPAGPFILTPFAGTELLLHRVDCPLGLSSAPTAF